MAIRGVKHKKRLSGKFLGIDYAMLPNRQWNQKQEHKKQPWGTWNASHLDLFLFAFSDNLISEDWFFAEGELFLSFWRCHRPRWGGRR